MDANKKIDLDHPLCPIESKILANILQNHPLRFSIAASLSVPWIYVGQFWHTLKEVGSKYRLSFMLDRKELTMTLDDFRTIFHLPQATDNNHDRLYYSLKHPTTLIPYPRFTKLIVSHYMTAFPEISRRARDKYHNLEDDDMVKSIFNSGKHKDGVGMKIPSWMITDEMKLTDNYRMYTAVFGVEVPTTQSQPIGSTHRTHKTISAPRTPNPIIDEGESSALQNSIVIRLRIPPRRSTRLTPPTPILTTAEADDIILQDTIQLSLAEQKKGMENAEIVEVDSSILRKDDNQTDPDTRLERMSDKESPEVEITAAEQPVNLYEEEEESIEDDYELRRREKRKHVEEIRLTPSPTTTRSHRIHSTIISSDIEKLQELTVNDPPPSSSTPSSSSSKLSVTQRIKEESLPKMIDKHVKELTKKQVPLYVAEGLIIEREKSQADVAKMIAEALQQERENLRA
ncbi:hypothetical protein Tco_0786456 [Tanacetum coccineum]